MISVTIAVYNTSRYLARCLDSIINQTLKDIEVIIVDDGSTDGSGKVCDEYEANDNRFRVIHQKNSGSAAARQTGLDNAHGEYVIVCDSDDWVEPDMYQKLYLKAKETNADMVLCGYFSEYNDSHSVPCQTIFNEVDGYVDNFDLIKRGAGSSWVKLIKKSLFEKTNASYVPGINLSEDSLILYKLMKGDPKVVQLKDNLYHYRRLYGGQSYTNNIKMEHIRQLRYTYDWLKTNYTEAQYEPLIYQRAIDLVFAYMRVNDLDKKSLSTFIRDELPWKAILSHKISAKGIIASSLKIIPYSFIRQLIRLCYRFVYK